MSCSIPPSVITVSSTSNVYTNQSNIITVNFSCVQSSAPGVISTSPPNGIINNNNNNLFLLTPVSPPASNGSSYTFTWTPTDVTPTKFTFSSVDDSNQGATSYNSITPTQQSSSLPCTTSVITLTQPSNVYTGQSNTITVNFSCVQSSTPTIVGTSPTNGTIVPLTLIPLSPPASSGSSYTFSWNPTNTILTNFTFNNVDGNSNTQITSASSITPTNQLSPALCTLTVTILQVPVYINITNYITVNFSCLQPQPPTLSTMTPSNGTISTLTPVLGTSYTFSWIPVTLSPTTFTFIGVDGTSNNVTVTSASITPLKSVPPLTPIIPPEEEKNNYNFIEKFYYYYRTYFIITCVSLGIFLLIIMIIFYFIFIHKKTYNTNF